MKFVTFTHDSDCRLGLLYPKDETLVIDLRRAAVGLLNAQKTSAGDDSALCSMQGFIEAGERGLDIAREVADSAGAQDPWVVELATTNLRAPIPQPVQFRDCLLFEEHLVNSFAGLRKARADQMPDPAAALREFEEKGLYQVPKVWYQFPLYYKVNRFSFIGPNQDIEWPSYSELLDYELEYACVLSEQLKNASPEDAERAIFGYTIYNDVSARDTQSREMEGLLGPSKGKDFDTGNVIGPCIVTKDAFNPADSRMIARINGSVVCEGNTGSARWSFPEVIVHASRSETLMPGEFFGSGTVGGGCGLETGKFLSPGDVIELEVEGIGVLANRVVR